MRQRKRAPDRSAAPAPSRTRKQGTPCVSAAKARRRVAVKSSACGAPHNSPTTAASALHLSPSSIAHSAARASRASTWTSSQRRPGGWRRPASRIAMRSCTHSSGPDGASAARRPVQPASRGWTENHSLRVGPAGAGRSRAAPAGCPCGHSPGRAADAGTRVPEAPPGRREGHDRPPAPMRRASPTARSSAARIVLVATRLASFLF